MLAKLLRADVSLSTMFSLKRRWKGITIQTSPFSWLPGFLNQDKENMNLQGISVKSFSVYYLPSPLPFFSELQDPLKIPHFLSAHSGPGGLSLLVSQTNSESKFSDLFLLKSLNMTDLQIMTFIVTLMRKKNPSSGEGSVCVEFVRSPHICVSFLPVRWFPPISQISARLGGLACITCPSLNECGCEWKCILQWNCVLSRAGFHLESWAAGWGSSHPRPWTEISELENKDLTCFY